MSDSRAPTPRDAGAPPEGVTALLDGDGAAVTPGEGGLETQRLRAAIGSRLFGEDEVRAPTKLGRHVLIEPLGAGGMGVVYAAYDPQLDRKVAIKVLHPRAGGSSEAAARLLREAQAMAKLNHPNVVAVHDAGIDGDQVFVAMEHVDGGTLASWCVDHPPADRRRFDDVLELMLQAARGLQAAHAAGLVHRDLKPTNLLVDGRGRLRVADLGLARADVSASEDIDGPTYADDELRADVTSGAIVGTPAYMAPEQLDGRGGASADQWAWCATAWEAVYGRRPFEGGSLEELRRGRQQGAPSAPSSRPEVPRWFHRVLARGLQPDPNARYPSMRALVQDLQRRRQRPRRQQMAAGAVVLGAVALGGWVTRPTPPSSVSPCTRITEATAAIFDEEMAESVEASVLARGQRRDETAAERIVGRLQGFSDEWSEGAARACRRLEAEVDLPHDVDPLAHPSASMACLSDARIRFEVVVDEVTKAEDTSNAFRILDTLPGLAACELGTELGPASTDVDREAARLVARAIVRGRVQDHTGARMLLERARQRLGETGSPSLRGRIEYVDGMLWYRSGDHAKAIDHGRAALGPAEEGSDANLVAEVWVLLADASRATDELEDAQFYLDRAASLVQRAGNLPWSRATVDRAQAAVWHELGDNERARQAGEAALRATEQLHGPDSYLCARLLSNHIKVLRELGRVDEAFAAAERVIEIYDRVYGREHPDTVRARTSQAHLLSDSGMHARAVTLYEEAYAAIADHPDVSPRDKMSAGLGWIQTLNASGRRDEARAAVADVLDAAAGWPGAEATMTPVLRMAAGAVELDAGNYEEAIALLVSVGTASDEGRAQLIPANRYTLCVNLAVAYARAARIEEALTTVDDCDARARTLVAPTLLHLPGSQRYLGEVFQRAGQLDEARRRYVVATEMLDVHAKTDPDRAAAHLGIGEIDLAQGRTDDLASHVAAAREVLDAQDDPAQRERLDALARAVP